MSAGQQKYNPYETGTSPPNSIDSRDPFGSINAPSIPYHYRDNDSDMGDPNYDRRDRETVESEVNLVDRDRAMSYTPHQPTYDSYNGASRSPSTPRFSPSLPRARPLCDHG